MAQSTSVAQPQADYGIDAPGVARGFAIFGAAGLAAGIGSYALLQASQPGLAAVLLLALGLGGLVCLAAFGAMAWSSRIGKFRARDRLLDSIPWRGDETVLDVGCGRGLLLIAAAKRLTSGRAIGVDVWSSKDQSGNRPESTRANARIEKVADRIEVRDGDARHLPFEAGTFDVVVSSLAIHNIEDREERAQAIREMVRVLKPGGRLAVLDVLHTGDYARALRDNGLLDVARSSPMFLFFSPDSRFVSARKPPAT